MITPQNIKGNNSIKYTPGAPDSMGSQPQNSYANGPTIQAPHESKRSGGLLRNTLREIPGMAKRLGRDAMQVGLGGVVQTAAPGAPMVPSIRAGARDISRAFRGQSDQNGYSALGNKKIPSFKKGGMIKKTGLAYVHKGEKVIPVGKSNALKKKMEC